MFLFYFSLAFAQENQSTCIVSSYFSPYDNIENVIHAQLITASTSVHCSLYGITNKRLADDLVALKRRGLDIAIGLDKTQSSGPHDLGKYLKQKGIKIVVKKTSALEHNKFCIIDNNRIIMGSWNWSGNAQKQDNSDVFITGCPEQIKRFEDAFQRILKRDLQ